MRPIRTAMSFIGIIPLIISVLFANVNAQEKAVESLPVRLKVDVKTVKVLLGDQHFTTIHQRGFDKPILYPVFGPGQTPMVRNWPMKKDVKGEATDHPHHKSIWFSHEINGTDFWSEKGGKVVTDRVRYNFKDPELKNAVKIKSTWIKKATDSPMFTSTTTFWFGGNAKTRWIDCSIVFHASHGDIHFEDTKEGMFAIRTHPDLRLSPDRKRGVEKVYGKAFNSEGVTGKAIWGKKAKWLVYQGEVNQQPVSMIMFDHPDNLRHPTTWHARDYGLVAANPFGLKHFLGLKGQGAYTVQAGDELKLRYRIEFIEGLVTAETAREHFQQFSR